MLFIVLPPRPRSALGLSFFKLLFYASALPNDLRISLVLLL